MSALTKSFLSHKNVYRRYTLTFGLYHKVEMMIIKTNLRLVGGICITYIGKFGLEGQTIDSTNSIQKPAKFGLNLKRASYLKSVKVDDSPALSNLSF